MTSRNPRIPRFCPAPISAPLTFADYHFLIYANGQRWPTVANLTMLTTRAAQQIRKRLIYRGLLEHTPNREPMIWTHAAHSLIERARKLGPIRVPADPDKRRQGRPLGSDVLMRLVDERHAAGMPSRS